MEFREDDEMPRVAEAAEPVSGSVWPSSDTSTSLLINKARKLLRGNRRELSPSPSCSVNSPFCEGPRIKRMFLVEHNEEVMQQAVDAERVERYRTGLSSSSVHETDTLLLEMTPGGNKKLWEMHSLGLNEEVMKEFGNDKTGNNSTTLSQPPSSSVNSSSPVEFHGDRMGSVLPIREIVPGMKNWSAKITVQEKQQITTSITTPTKKQRFIFIDFEGSQVEGIIFSSDIPVMSPRIHVCKKYLISNADIRDIPQKYRTSQIAIQWVITTKTLIEEMPDDGDIIPVNFTYTAFKDLVHYVDQRDNPVDVLAVVVQALEKTPVKKNNKSAMVQKFVIVNEQLQPILLSLWDDFFANEGAKIVEKLHTYPVIICRRLKVGYYNGVCLSTWFDSVILVDPPIQEARELKNWAMRNTIELSKIVDQEVYKSNNVDLSFQTTQKTTLVANVLPTQKSIWVKAQISFDHIYQRYWYMGCKKCFRATSASHGVAFLCNSCQEKHPPQPRCRFDIDLTDESGTITASIFGELAQKLLTLTALEAMDYFNKNMELPLHMVHHQLKQKLFLVHIKPVQSQMPDRRQRYTVIYYCESSEEKNQQQLAKENVPASTSTDKQPQTSDLDISGTETSSSRV